MRIFCGHDGGTGCGWYRMLMWGAELPRHGYDVTMRDADVDKRGDTGITARDMDGHDVIVAQRFNKPGAEHLWRRARTPFNRLVYELDDDVFNITPDNFAAYTLWKNPLIRDAAIHNIEVSDLITTTTQPLAELLREYNPNVMVIPNQIPAWVCDYQRSRRDRPAVGWAGGGSHGADVGLIVTPVRRFLQRFKGWDLRLAGTDYRVTFKAGDRAVFTPWVHVTDDPHGFYTVPDWDIGLAPLVPTQFTRCKSAIKALEWAALGIPTIASDWPPYSDFIRHGETGFIVKHDHEWLKYMSLLAADDDLRESMGTKAREQARQFTMEGGGWRLWAEAFEGLFPAKRGDLHV